MSELSGKVAISTGHAVLGVTLAPASAQALSDLIMRDGQPRSCRL